MTASLHQCVVCSISFASWILVVRMLALVLLQPIKLSGFLMPLLIEWQWLYLALRRHSKRYPNLVVDSRTSASLVAYLHAC